MPNLRTSYFFEAVILTTQATGTPHAGALQAANPGLKIHVYEGAEKPDKVWPRIGWRNCDRNIRNWWREHRAEVATRQVIFLEWDVWVGVDLREVLGPIGAGVGLTAAGIVSRVLGRREYRFFEEASRLPRDLWRWAVAANPLAFLRLTREALDAVARAEYDAAFEADVFCELRLPTVVRHAGFQVAAEALPDVGTTPRVPDRAGVFHPVKKEVAR